MSKRKAVEDAEGSGKKSLVSDSPLAILYQCESGCWTWRGHVHRAIEHVTSGVWGDILAGIERDHLPARLRSDPHTFLTSLAYYMSNTHDIP